MPITQECAHECPSPRNASVCAFFFFLLHPLSCPSTKILLARGHAFCPRAHRRPFAHSTLPLSKACQLNKFIIYTDDKRSNMDCCHCRKFKSNHHCQAVVGPGEGFGAPGNPTRICGEVICTMCSSSFGNEDGIF